MMRAAVKLYPVGWPNRSSPLGLVIGRLSSSSSSNVAAAAAGTAAPSAAGTAAPSVAGADSSAAGAVPSAAGAASFAATTAPSAAATAPSPSQSPRPKLPAYHVKEFNDVLATHAHGLDVLHNPCTNKGTAHALVERERLGLRGLLPARVLTLDDQIHRAMARYRKHQDWLTDDGGESGITHEALRRWDVLQELQDRNETLFYRLLIDNFVEMSPIIYTPTVAHVCLNFHRFFRRPRGMVFSAADRGEMATMAYNWPADTVDAIVVTDGSRILGLGDLGACGLGISIGKLDLYVAAAGFHPSRILPVVLDVGTDNRAMRDDPWYLGLRQPRVSDDEYYDIVDEFVAAVMGRWPQAVLQFEDFNLQHAQPLLERYRSSHTMFNDDIQGTAATALAGLLGAMAVQGRPHAALADQRVFVVGAGSAGMGVVRMIAQAMVRYGVSPSVVAERFHIFDSDGLVTAARRDLPTHVAPFARRDAASVEGESLLDAMQRVKPTVLIGLAGAGRLFGHEVLESMARHCERPIVFAMSNPTANMECTAEEAQAATGGRAIFASGSPQPDVEFGDRLCASSQANNLYIFPGLALGSYLAKGNAVSDHMILAATEALSDLITDAERDAGRVFPSLDNIRNVSLHVACAVIKAAAEEGRVACPSLIRALGRGDDALQWFVRERMYVPEYKSLVCRRGEGG